MRRAFEAQQAAYEAARAVLDRARARRDASWQQAAAENRRRAMVVLLSPFAVGVVLGVLGIFTIAPAIAGGLLIVGWAVVVALSWRYAANKARSALGGTDLGAAVAGGIVSARGAERVEDLTESLCAGLGLPVPELRLLADPAPNAVTLGRRASLATLVVTSALVDGLDRIELEGVLAHELSHVKRLDILTGSLGASPAGRVLDVCSGGRAQAYLVGRCREVRADLAAVSTTRYPPGLLAGLERVCTAATREPSSVPPRVRASTARLWLAPFTGGELSERADILREL